MLRKVTQDETFKASLSVILRFIALDSKTKAQHFKKGLRQGLGSLIYMPYKFRKSVYFDDSSIRDYIYKGYCIPYLIDEENEQIVLLDIIKWNEK